MDFGGGEVDPVKYGMLWQRVQDMDCHVGNSCALCGQAGRFSHNLSAVGH